MTPTPELVPEILELVLGGPPTIVVAPSAMPNHCPPVSPHLKTPIQLLLPTPESDGTLANRLSSVLPDAIPEREALRVFVAAPAIPAGPAHSLRHDLASRKLLGEQAAIGAIVEHLRDGDRVALVTSAAVLTDPGARPLREALLGLARLDWAIELGPVGGGLIGSPGSPIGLLVLERGPAGHKLPVRLLDLSACPPAEWIDRLQELARRQSGESTEGVVLRGQDQLAVQPWRQAPFRRQFAEIREDAGQLGSTRPLSSLAEILTGTSVKDLTQLLRIRSAAAQVACYSADSLKGGRRIGKPRHLLESVPSAAELREGDLLVATTLREGAPVMGRVTADTVPATFDSTLLAVRFRPDVTAPVRELVEGYLGSAHAGAWLAAHGGGSLKPAVLAQLEVPDPNADVLEALLRLATAETEYLRWALEAREARSALFAQASFRATVPHLLEARSREDQRIAAARASGTLDHRAQTAFPHPLAVRWLSAHAGGDPKAVIERSLDCAESAVTLVALVGIVQLQALGHLQARTAPKRLGREEPRIDWGTMRSLLGEVVHASHAASEPLALPLPELAMVDISREAPWQQAERRLREVRNTGAHGHRRTPRALDALATSCLEDLDTVLDGLRVLASINLVAVDRCELHPLTSGRQAAVRRLRGAHPVFRQELVESHVELAMGGVALLDQQGRLHDLSPWLLFRLCDECQREELFAFSRMTADEVTYLAMESGHAWHVAAGLTHWNTIFGL